MVRERHLPLARDSKDVISRAGGEASHILMTPSSPAVAT
jgi:hypothetical protein